MQRWIVVFGIGALFAAVGVLPGRCLGAPVVNAPIVTPPTLPGGHPVNVLVTSQIRRAASDPLVVANSVYLQRVDAADAFIANLGTMHDDGMGGDAMAGDGNYSLQVTLNEPAGSQVRLRVSAAFVKVVRRILSAVTVVAVVGVDPRDSDDDHDGFTENAGDCDDSNAAIHPNAPERCNTVDDDCDGTLNEGFDVGAPCAVGVGACAAQGTKICSADGTTTICDAVPGAPQAEHCNGIDDNCDGATDEGFTLGAICTVGLGACAAQGTEICSADGATTICDAVPGAPQAEQCNGIDDNCDGAIDEGFTLGAICTVGLGACAQTGVTLCSADGSGTQCSATPGSPSPEICGNGVDEDCDGADLGCPASGNGVVAGEVFDDSTGLPIANATIRLVSLDGAPPAPPIPAVVSDPLGRFRIASPAGIARLHLSKSSFTESYREVEIIAGKRTDPLDARLTPLDTGETPVSSVLGGAVISTGADAMLAIPAGALAQDQAIRLTRLGSQGLAAPLPVGWSPIAAVDVFPHDVLLTTSAVLSTSNSVAFVSAVPVVARWDATNEAWIAAGRGRLVGTQLEADLPLTGQYAFLVADLVPASPPVPVEGQPLLGNLASPLPGNVTGVIAPAPRILFADPHAHSQVRIGASAASPPSSGTVLQLGIVEAFDLPGTRHLYPDPVIQDVTLYQRPPAAEGVAVVTVSPSRAFDPLALQLGVIDVAAQSDQDAGMPRGDVVGSAGGTISIASGEGINILPGAAAADLPVLLSPLVPTDFPAAVPSTLVYLGGATVDLHGGTLSQPARLSIPTTTALPLGAQVLVVRLSEFDGASYLALVALARRQGNDLVSETDPHGDGSLILPGILGDGRYVFLLANMPLGFITGTVFGDSAQPRAGALISTDVLTITALTDVNGHYAIAAPLGTVVVTATDSVTHDAARASGSVNAAGAVVGIDLSLASTPATVVSVTPAAGAVDVPLASVVKVVFSEPVDLASVSSASATLSDGTHLVSGTVSLSPDLQTLTFRPDTFLQSQTTYALTIAGSIQDLAGNPLGANFTAQFTTVDRTPPAAPAAGQISASIPGANGSSTVSGTQGTADPNGLVLVRNLTTGTLTTFTPNADGSFGGTVAASRADRLELIIRDAAGNETTLPLGPFRNADGSVVVGSSGGRVDGAGGVFVDIPAGALPDGTVVRVVPVSEAALPLAVPAGFPFIGGVRLDLGGVTPLAPLDVGAAAPADATLQDQVLVTRVVQLPRRQAWTVVDRAHLQNGQYVTASPPFSGVTSEATFAFVRFERQLITAGPNGTLDSFVAFGSDDQMGTRVGLGAVISAGPDGILQTPPLGDDVVQRDCASYVAQQFQFGFDVFITLQGIPFVIPAAGVGTATLPAVCDSQFDIEVHDANTEQVIQQITTHAPVVQDDIFFPSGVLSDDMTPPAIIASNVVSGAPLDELEVLFTEPMNVLSVATNFVVTDSVGVSVPGTVQLTQSNTLATFRPALPFRLGETYTLALAGVTDLAGNLVQAAPINFTPYAPQSLSQLGSDPLLAQALQKCDSHGACSTGARDVAVIGTTLFIANGVAAADEQYHDPANPTRLLAVDVGDPRHPRLIGFQATTTNPRAVAGISAAAFTLPNGTPFAGDLLVVVGGGRVAGGELNGKLEIYDVTACTHRIAVANCLDPSLQPLKGSKLLSTPAGVPPKPGVPPDSGVPLQLAVLHQHAPTGDTVAAYVTTVPIGVEAVDITRAFNLPIGPTTDVAPDGLVRGDFLDVAVLKNLVLAVDSNATLTVFSPQLQVIRTIVLPASARVAAVENLVFDVDADGNLGLAEDGDADALTARGELFDLAIVGSGPLTQGCTGTIPCGEVYVVDLSALTDLAHASPPGLIKRIPVPGPAFSIQVDAAAQLAYAEVRGQGLAIIDLSSLFTAGLVDHNGDGIDDRVLGIFPKNDLFVGEIKVDLARGIAYVNGTSSGIEAVCVDGARCAAITIGLRSASLDMLEFPSTDASSGTVQITPEAWGSSVQLCINLDVQVTPAQPITYTISEIPVISNALALDLSNGQDTGVLNASNPQICLATHAAEPLPFESYLLLSFHSQAGALVGQALVHLAPAMVIATDARVRTQIDRINGAVCEMGDDLNFQLSEPADVTITIDGNVIEQNIARAAGRHALPISTALVSLPGEHDVAITAVFAGATVPFQTTALAKVVHDVELAASFPLGHTMIKGVDIWDGHLTHTRQDVAIPGRGLSLELTRTYSSAGSSSAGPLGAGWTHSYNVELVHDSCGRFVVIGGEGTGNAFRFNGSTYDPQVGYHSTLVRDPQDSSKFDFFTKARTRYHFEREPARTGETYTLRFIEDPNGNRISLDYLTGDGDPTTVDVVTDSSGRSLLFEYQQVFNQKRLSRLTGLDPGGTNLLGIEVIYDYDTAGNLVGVTRKSPNPLAGLNDERVETYAYTTLDPLDQHNLRFVTDPNGNTTEYVYYSPLDVIPGVDAFGLQRHEIIRAVLQPENVTTEFAYDFTSNNRMVTDPRASDSQDPVSPPPTTYTLNVYGATVQVDAPLGKTTTTQWCTDAPSPACPNHSGNPGLDVLKVQEIDAEGRTHRYEYADGLGNLTKETILFTGTQDPVTLADGTTAVAQISTSYTYEPSFSQMTSKTDAEGNTTVYLVDAPYAGKPTFCPDSTPGVDTGKLLGVRDPEGNVSCYAYALNGDRLSVKDARGFTTTYAYDAFGNAATITDPEGNAALNTFDTRSRLRETRNTFTHHARYFYDGLDRQIRTERLDDLGEQGTPQINTTLYLPNGEPAEVTDGLGQTTRYVYDGLNRNIEKREEDVLQADGSTAVLRTQYAYDRGSNIIEEIDARGISHHHAFDALNRRVTTSIQGAFTTNEVVLTTTYDLVNNQLSHTDLHGHTTSYRYDGLYRVVETGLPFPNAVVRTAYDRVGNKIRQTDANGAAMTLAYDHDYRVVRKTDAVGNAVVFTYDAASNKTREENLSTGLVTDYLSYDRVNRLTSMRQTVPLGGPGLTTAVYDTAVAYDDHDNAVVTTNPRGFRSRSDRDGLDRVVQTIVDLGGLNLTATFTYDANGNVATVSDPQGGDIDATHEYDGLNRKIRSTYASTPGDAGQTVSEEFVYDGNNNVVQYKDKRAITLGQTYDNLDRLLTKTVTESISNGGIDLTLLAYAYNDATTAVTLTDANGNATTTYSDGLHRAHIVDDPDPNGSFNPAGPGPFPTGLQVNEYDGVYQRARIDKKGHRTEYDYDPLNRLVDTREFDLSGAQRTTLHTAYIDQQNQRQDTDRRGIVTTSQFDALQRSIQLRRSGLDMATHYGANEVLLETHEYDANGNRTAFIDAQGNRTASTYDGADRLITVTAGVASAVQATTATTYDNVGNVLSIKDGRQHGGVFDVQYQYDARYRAVKATNGELEDTTYAFDANNNLVQLTEPLGAAFTTTYRYDELNKLLAVDESARTDAATAAGVTRYFYDGNRNKIAQQDANGNLATYKYDGLNRLTDSFQHTVAGSLTDQTTRGVNPMNNPAGGDDASALHRHYEYDLNGNQTRIVDAKGQQTNSSYDYLNRLQTMTYSQHATPALDFQMQSIAYVYDGNGNVENVSEVKTLGGGTISEGTLQTFDPLDRLQSSTRRDHDDPTGKRIEYDYDVQGNRTAVTDPDSVTTRYTYDARNRLATATTEAGLTTYTYWEDNLLKTVAYPNGSVSDRSAANAYDRADRLMLVTNRPNLSSYAYVYDHNGNRLSQVESQSVVNGGAPETTTYTYDNVNRVLSVSYGTVGHVAYTYEPNGNRHSEVGTDPHTGQPIDRTYNYQQLATKVGVTFSHVNALSQIVDNLNAGESVIYEYDGNLNQVAKEKTGIRTEFRFGIRDEILSSDELSGTQVMFDYDHDRMRTKKVSGASSQETRYLYDDDAVLVEYDGSASTRPTVHKYDYGNALLSVTQVGLSGQQRDSQFYLADGLISTANLTDEAGALVQSYRYDAWGRVRDRIGTSSNPRQYTGHYHDDETGLSYFGARYYDDETGRFLSQDSYPGQATRPPSLHRYLYAYANPLRFVDPTGLASEDANFPYWEDPSYLGEDEHGVPTFTDVPQPLPNPCANVQGPCNPRTKEVDDYVNAENKAYAARNPMVKELEDLSKSIERAQKNLETYHRLNDSNASLEFFIGYAGGIGEAVYTMGAEIGNFGVDIATGLLVQTVGTDQDKATWAAGEGLRSGISKSINEGRFWRSNWEGIKGLPESWDESMLAAAVAADRGDWRASGAAFSKPVLDLVLIADGAQAAGKAGVKTLGAAADEAGMLRRFLADETGSVVGGAPPPPRRTAFAGHATWDVDSGFVIVPKGTTISIPAPLGGKIADSLGRALERGTAPPTVRMRTFGPGEKVPNLTLKPPGSLITEPTSVTVELPTRLKDLLKPDMGECVWAACTLRPLSRSERLMQTLEGMQQTPLYSQRELEVLEAEAKLRRPGS